MKQRKVWLESPTSGYAPMMMNWGWKVVAHADDADLMLFTGGSDVSPMLYGQESHPRTMNDLVRDQMCSNYFHHYFGMPFVGICRGGQFLNVMSGGMMYQHVDGHATGKMHEAFDVSSGESLMVTSTHHQMMVPSDEAELILFAKEAKVKEWEETKQFDLYPDMDVEACFYEETNSLCFQPHPEFFGQEDECQQFFMNILEQYLF